MPLTLKDGTYPDKFPKQRLKCQKPHSPNIVTTPKIAARSSVA